MILLLGTITDPVMANVCSRLSARDCEIQLIDPRQYPHQVNLTWSMDLSDLAGTIQVGKRRLNATEIQSAYIRQLSGSPTAITSNLDGKISTPISQSPSNGLREFVDSLPGIVVNRNRAVCTNGSKPYQQRIIAEHGFRVPRTLITTIPEEAASFFEECLGRVIYKSVSAERSIVKRMTADDLRRLDQIRNCPVQLQEYVPGVDIRVHTIGSRVLASEVVTEAMDYRYADREGAMRMIRAVEITPELAERCLNLARGLGLVMSGIDLRRTLDGEYYCFEVNPSPAFTFYENHTGQRIGDALADLLCHGIA